MDKIGNVYTFLGICFIVGLVLGFIIRKFVAEKMFKAAEFSAQQLLRNASKEAAVYKKNAELEAKNMVLDMRSKLEHEHSSRRQELISMEKRLVQREENLDRKVSYIDRKTNEVEQFETGLKRERQRIEEKNKVLNRLIEEEKGTLVRISGVSAEQAKAMLIEKIKKEASQDAARGLRKLEEETKERAKRLAQNIIGQAIQRYASEYTISNTVSVVNLPNEDMKGRIIGREGRNIRSFEMATGIDIIIDDTPEAVVLSSFDVVRREIARIALEELIANGRIHPARIEELVVKAKEEVETGIKEEGDRVVDELGISDMAPELIRLIGRLKYRTSYGQNVLQHSKDVAYLMAIMASELGLDPRLAKRAGILHDIGKAVSHEVEGPHAIVGAELAKRHGETGEVLKAIEQHNEDVPIDSVWGFLACAADAISAARPGARKDTLDLYIKRLEKLEKVALGFEGVEKCYAIQSGRELRIMVSPDQMNDKDACVLSHEIKKAIEEKLDYPGQIKVVVIRETRAVDYAK